MDTISHTAAREKLSKEVEETTYLLRSPANAQNLLESIAALEEDKGIERELLE